MGFPSLDIALSLAKSKLVLVGGGTVVAAGVSTPIALTATNANSVGIIPNSRLSYYFSKEKIDELIEKVKSIKQSGDSHKSQPKIPSEAEQEKLLTTLQNINNYGQENYTRLSKDQREDLLALFRLYEELEHSRISQVSNSSIFVDGLVSLSWDKDQIKFFKDSDASKDTRWGWKDWNSNNPFWVVYDQNESKWTEKMDRLGSESLQDESVAKEMEYDIFSKILEEMVRVHENYLK